MGMLLNSFVWLCGTASPVWDQKVLERRGRQAEAALQYRTALALGVGGDGVASASLGRRGARGGFLHNLGLLLAAQAERIAEANAASSATSSLSSLSALLSALGTGGGAVANASADVDADARGKRLLESANASADVDARGKRLLESALVAALSALEEAAAAWPHLDSLTEVLTVVQLVSLVCLMLTNQSLFFFHLTFVGYTVASILDCVCLLDTERSCPSSLSPPAKKKTTNQISSVSSSFLPCP